MGFNEARHKPGTNRVVRDSETGDGPCFNVARRKCPGKLIPTTRSASRLPTRFNVARRECREPTEGRCLLDHRYRASMWPGANTGCTSIATGPARLAHASMRPGANAGINWSAEV